MTETDPHHQPEVFEADWDRDQVDAFFDDLKRGAEVKRVQVRTTSGNNRPDESVVTLEQARRRLDNGRTTAIQIYYEYEDKTWCDTLMISPNTIRIVRTTVPKNR